MQTKLFPSIVRLPCRRYTASMIRLKSRSYRYSPICVIQYPWSLTPLRSGLRNYIRVPSDYLMDSLRTGYQKVPRYPAQESEYRVSLQRVLCSLRMMIKIFTDTQPNCISVPSICFTCTDQTGPPHTRTPCARSTSFTRKVNSSTSVSATTCRTYLVALSPTPKIHCVVTDAALEPKLGDSRDCMHLSPEWLDPAYRFPGALQPY